jgi:hypothetical protein
VLDFQSCARRLVNHNAKQAIVVIVHPGAVEKLAGIEFSPCSHSLAGHVYHLQSAFSTYCFFSMPCDAANCEFSMLHFLFDYGLGNDHGRMMSDGRTWDGVPSGCALSTYVRTICTVGLLFFANIHSHWPVQVRTRKFSYLLVSPLVPNCSSGSFDQITVAGRV